MIKESIEDKNLMEYYTTEVEKYFKLFAKSIIDTNKIKYFDKSASENLTDYEFQKNFEENNKLLESLESINISYMMNIKNAGGWADYNNNEIVINASNVLYIKSLIIHEFSHHLINILSRGRIKGHTLEFAIFNYCLLNRYEDSLFSKDFHLIEHDKSLFSGRTNFFRSYDIRDEPSIALLSINVFKFDSLIKNIQFETLQDLFKKSCKYAGKIRNKAIEI
ncbi:hypothetical protein [Methylotenera sp. 1P/1]|uniref:hypothetical protein n=1 Tax=Methylotenera sp. 1P/1 TaxID=1131551 RepID=UPI000379F862|nr:hypothetical protein [Methylotenera sp. 1P/1]